MTTYNCTYTYDFPVDEFGRLGGLYSLADLPIATHERMVRVGILEGKNEESQMYKVRDKEKNFVRWIPMIDVEIGEEVDA